MTLIWTFFNSITDATYPIWGADGTLYTAGSYCAYYSGAKYYLIANTPGCFMFRLGACYVGTGTQCNGGVTYTGVAAAQVFTVGYEYY
jgi:hypothetical protein